MPWGIATVVLVLLAASMFWVAASRSQSPWSDPWWERETVYKTAAWICLGVAALTVIGGLYAIWHLLPLAIVVLIAWAFLSRRPPPRRY